MNDSHDTICAALFNFQKKNGNLRITTRLPRACELQFEFDKTLAGSFFLKKSLQINKRARENCAALGSPSPSLNRTVHGSPPADSPERPRAAVPIRPDWPRKAALTGIGTRKQLDRVAAATMLAL